MLITQTKIIQLRSGVSHADLDAIKATFGESPTAEQLDDLNTYLSRYAVPMDGNPCLACNQRDSFQWGVQHGEGNCNNCQWPGTLYHFINDRNGEQLVVIRGLLLWHHPDFVDAGG